MLRVNQLTGFGGKAVRGTGAGWFPIFAPPLTSLTNTNNLGDRTYRQQVRALGLTRDAPLIRFYLRAASAQGFSIDEMWFGQQAASGDVYDMAASPAPVQVKFWDAAALIATPGQTIITDTVAFALDRTKNHILSWHAVAPNTSSGYTKNNTTLVSIDWGFNGYYSSAGVNQASVQNVTSYSLNIDCAAIMRIEGADAIVWEPALDVGSFSGKGTARAGNTRQVLTPMSLGGSRVRLVVSAAVGESWNIDALWLGEQATTGDAWDMKTTPTPVRLFVGGSGTFAGASGTTVTTDAATFTIDPTKNYVVAAHHDGMSFPERTGMTGCQTYSKSGASEAATADVSGYTLEVANAVQLVRRVEVTR